MTLNTKSAIQKITKIIGLSSILILFSVGTAQAIQGQWTGKYYYISNGNSFGGSYTDGNCFLSDGTWYSTNAKGVKGHWYQKGNDLYLNASDGVSVFSANLKMLNSKIFTGEHQHWAIDGSTNPLWYLTETLTFNKTTCDLPA